MNFVCQEGFTGEGIQHTTADSGISQGKGVNIKKYLIKEGVGVVQVWVEYDDV